jgi:hypothetical protein
LDWDDELDGMIHGAGNAGLMPDDISERRLDPMELREPASAYLLLSDDGQDEIIGTDKKRMKCRACGRRFTGEIHDRCPKRDSLDTGEV